MMDPSPQHQRCPFGSVEFEDFRPSSAASGFSCYQGRSLIEEAYNAEPLIRNGDVDDEVDGDGKSDGRRDGDDAPRPRRSDLPWSTRRDDVRLVTWNIERGYKLEEIVATLRATPADVICLQEVDVRCERSGGKDTGREIARRLGMNYMYVCEFEEIYSSLRPPELQGGGCHGHAVLTRFDFDRERCGVIKHESQPFDWHRDGPARKEPRRGRRITQFATIVLPSGGAVNPTQSSKRCKRKNVNDQNPRDDDVDRFLVYNTHAELFCGITDRLRVFADIFEHSREQSRTNTVYQAIMGDLNTLAHSIARLGGAYCRDRLRWRTLGLTEPEWLMRNVLWWTEVDGPVNKRVLEAGQFDEAKDSVVREIVNPGFYDPFDVYHDVTLTNYRSLFQGKLDWVLLLNLAHKRKRMINVHLRDSDHRGLVVHARLVRDRDEQVHRGNVRRIVRQTTTSRTLDYMWGSLIIAIMSSFLLLLFASRKGYIEI